MRPSSSASSSSRGRAGASGGAGVPAAAAPSGPGSAAAVRAGGVVVRTGLPVAGSLTPQRSSARSMVARKRSRASSSADEGWSSTAHTA